jgi:hypothetical protein
MKIWERRILMAHYICLFLKKFYFFKKNLILWNTLTFFKRKSNLFLREKVGWGGFSKVALF